MPGPPEIPSCPVPALSAYAYRKAVSLVLASWLNAVENFFSVLTRKRIRRGTFYSLIDLQAAIKRYLTEHNKEPKPFVWTASAASILAKLNRLSASCA